MLNLRTDLAVESVYTHEHEGIAQEQETIDGVTITRIEIKSSVAAELVGKPMGKFVTLEGEDICSKEPEILEKMTQLLADEIKKILPEFSGKILIVGLGNRSITPDALGPCVTDRVMVTNHVMEHLAKDGETDFRAVSAVTPGVMGVTGLETVEIIKGITEQYRPSLLIAVDALCAQSPERMFHTIQLTDTGIHPGSGVGNRREGLNSETLGVPVIAIGIPTVVDSNAIVYHVLRRFFEANESLTEAENMIHGMLRYADDRMFVCPKDVDGLIAGSARIVANGINLALHRNIDIAFAENFVS